MDDWNGGIGFINVQGEIIVPDRFHWDYDNDSAYREGCFIGSVDGELFIYDRQGNRIY